VGYSEAQTPTIDFDWFMAEETASEDFGVLGAEDPVIEAGIGRNRVYAFTGRRKPVVAHGAA
jgi:hypothetical protein